MAVKLKLVRNAATNDVEVQDDVQRLPQELQEALLQLNDSIEKERKETENLMKKRKSVAEEEDESPKKKKSKKSADVAAAGDWYCGDCGAVNPVYLRVCKECHHFNPEADTSGDWMCPAEGCLTSNFANRDSCRVCRMKKDGSGTVREEGDWECKNKHCKFINFARRTNTCRKCGQFSGIIDPACGCNTAYRLEWRGYKERYQCLNCENSSTSLDNIASHYYDEHRELLPTPDLIDACFPHTGPNGEDMCKFCSDEIWGYALQAFHLFIKHQLSHYDSATLIQKGWSTIDNVRSSDWFCECGINNRVNRDKCINTSCEKRKNYPSGHKIGMSHLAFTCTEDDIKKFFLPLVCEKVKIVTNRAYGKPTGKANVWFKTHAECCTAMYKDKGMLCDFEVNLYNNSIEEANGAETDADTTLDTSCHREPTTVDADTTLDTPCDRKPAKKKFKWDKMITGCIKASPKKLTTQKLQKCLLPQYTKMTGEVCSKSEFSEKLGRRLSNSDKFTLVHGAVSLNTAPPPAH